MDASRIELAEAFLREAVYRSRARQGLIGALSSADPAAPGACGLGEKAAVVLELDAGGAALFTRLFEDGLEDRELERVRGMMSDWIRRQDALDRQRNHFLKAFRHEHGFDRTAYGPELERRYEEGLAAINDRANRELREAARALIDGRG
jgi:hypothetical protein